MLQEINLFDQQKIGLQLSQRLLPSYKKIIGKSIGKFYIDSLCRKNNRNLLKCVCQCGRVQYLYRWQLKNRKCCEFCQKNQKQNIEDVSKQFFKQIQLFALAQHINFKITYDYANRLFHKQNKRCALSRTLLNASQKQQNRNAYLGLIQPQKGYINGNVQWISINVANMKNGLNDHDFLKLCKKITTSSFKNSRKYFKTQNLL